MGEKSRLIGEYGEKTVENFLNLIGWGNAYQNIEISCSKLENHNKKSGGTHGIDAYFSYNSPLADGVLSSVNISTKFSGNPYPNSPISTFKKHCNDLFQAIECFKISSNRREISQNISGYNKTDEVAVLFWLTNDDTSYQDLLSKLSTASFDDNYKFDTLYVIDNLRIEFVYKCIKFTQNIYSNSIFQFYYPDTGKNLIPQNKMNYGNILPVEYLNSSILIFRIENENDQRISLILFTIDNFNRDDLKRLIGLTQDISKSWANEIIIAFPDYNELNHSNDVTIAKNAFINMKLMSRLKIVSYNENFRTLQNN